MAGGISLEQLKKRYDVHWSDFEKIQETIRLIEPNGNESEQVLRLKNLAVEKLVKAGEVNELILVIEQSQGRKRQTVAFE